MKKILLISGLWSLVSGIAAADISMDTTDPLFLTPNNRILSQTNAEFFDDILRVSQGVSYGINDRFVIGADLIYQSDFDGDMDGLSNVGINGILRMGNCGGNGYITDLIGGVRFSGAKRVPEFSETNYTVGLRVGKQWSGMTASVIAKSTWQFGDIGGASWVDIAPNLHLRLTENWTADAGFVLRKSTAPNMDTTFIGGGIARRWGYTMYRVRADYDFEADDIKFTAGINILF